VVAEVTVVVLVAEAVVVVDAGGTIPGTVVATKAVTGDDRTARPDSATASPHPHP
jgi:hypothetical protein